MDTDGSNQEEVVSLPGTDLAIPVYSPGGGLIAFSTFPDGDLYVHNIYLGVTHNLRDLNPLFTAQVLGGLAWAPDGLSLIFHSDPDPTDRYHPTQLEIFTIDRSGSNFTQLTDNKDGADAFPQWAADGNTIYYTTQYPMNWFKLYSMDPDGSRIGRLTTLPLESGFSELYFDINGKSINPVTDVAFFNTGVTYYNLGYFKQAVSAFTEVIRQNPQSSAGYHGRADAYGALGMAAEAQAD